MLPIPSELGHLSVIDDDEWLNESLGRAHISLTGVSFVHECTFCALFMNNNVLKEIITVRVGSLYGGVICLNRQRKIAGKPKASVMAKNQRKLMYVASLTHQSPAYRIMIDCISQN